MPTHKKDEEAEPLDSLILLVRGRRVIADLDLARVYGVATKVLNQAVKRNSGRFPEDFAFQLTEDEVNNLKSQIVTSRLSANQRDTYDRTQSVTGSHGGTRKAPWVFSEHGALMAANVLRSTRAVQMSIAIFIRLADIDGTLLRHDTALRDVCRKRLPLLAPPAAPAKRRIGF